MVLGRRPLGAVLHSSNESGELSQWLCHDDSTIDIVLDIIIIIIIIIVIVTPILMGISSDPWDPNCSYSRAHLQSRRHAAARHVTSHLKS